jgi:hypothetical protein
LGAFRSPPNPFGYHGWFGCVKAVLQREFWGSPWLVWLYKDYEERNIESKTKDEEKQRK